MRPLRRQYAIIWSAPDIPLGSDLRSVLELLVVQFVVELREHFNALNLEKQIANFRMNLMLNYMIRMTISSWWLEYNARREASGQAEFDRNMERLREAVHEASVNKSRE